MILELHPSIKAMRGKTGQWIYKKVGNTTYAADKPKASTKPPTTDQQQARDRFVLATNYAKAVVADPQSKALYEPASGALGKPVFALAGRHGPFGDADMQPWCFNVTFFPRKKVTKCRFTASRTMICDRCGRNLLGIETHGQSPPHVP